LWIGRLLTGGEEAASGGGVWLAAQRKAAAKAVAMPAGFRSEWTVMAANPVYSSTLPLPDFLPARRPRHSIRPPPATSSANRPRSG
jgi:hypothetical protein